LPDVTKAYDYESLHANDFVGRIGVLLRKGWFISNITGKLTLPNERKIDVKSPWVHIKKAPQRRCILKHYVLWDCFKVIHSQCYDCYKVVVEPRNVKELFQLHDIMAQLNYYSKCGIEKRPWVGRQYGGYFYNDSIGEGREKYDTVRAAVSKHISPDVPVKLKRGCTEFEMRRGPSDKWIYTNEDKFWDAMCEKWTDIPLDDSEQSGILKVHIRKMWLDREYAINPEVLREFCQSEKTMIKAAVAYNDNDNTPEVSEYLESLKKVSNGGDNV
jgi:hypothetical protein